MSTYVKHLEEHVVIPPDRKVTIEFPPEIPEGEAVVQMYIEFERRKPKKTSREELLKLAGAWKNRDIFAGDSVAIIREMRDEW